MKNKAVHFFLGCSSSEGFASFFSELYDFDLGWRPYFIKGGAGTGKSSLMKNIADRLEKSGYEVERVHCSSDPSSLDGVICRELKFSIADATSPHVLEPSYPGAVENIINLGEYWNKKALFDRREEIIALTKSNSLLHARCARFLSAAGKVRYDTQKLCEKAVLEYKIHSYADRFSRRRFKKASSHPGKEKRVFLSAITPRGQLFFKETVSALASEIILVDDPTFIASGMLLEELKNLALKNGHDVISSFCPLQPSGRPEHIIIPELSLAFLRCHDDYPIKGERTIHTTRFLDEEMLSKRKNRLGFNQRMEKELVGEAILSLREAKRIHDDIEKIYISSMDFSEYDSLCEKILSEIIV